MPSLVGGSDPPDDRSSRRSAIPRSDNRRGLTSRQLDGLGHTANSPAVNEGPKDPGPRVSAGISATEIKGNLSKIKENTKAPHDEPVPDTDDLDSFIEKVQIRAQTVAERTHSQGTLDESEADSYDDGEPC